jgi:hypothetical protein
MKPEPVPCGIAITSRLSRLRLTDTLVMNTTDGAALRNT